MERACQDDDEGVGEAKDGEHPPAFRCGGEESFQHLLHGMTLFDGLIDDGLVFGVVTDEMNTVDMMSNDRELCLLPR